VAPAFKKGGRNLAENGATGEVHHTMLRLFSHTTSTLDVSIHENKVIGTDFSSTDTYLHVFTHILVNSSLFAVN